MSIEQHESLIRRYIDEVFNDHNLTSLDQFWIADLASHWMGQETLRGLPAWTTAMSGFFGAFPDITYSLDDLFFAGDRGVWRGTWHGTMLEDWAGVAASGQVATWTAVIIGRFEDGKMAEDWVEYNRFGLFRQLGAFPIGQ